MTNTITDRRWRALEIVRRANARTQRLAREHNLPDSFRFRGFRGPTLPSAMQRSIATAECAMRIAVRHTHIRGD